MAAFVVPDAGAVTVVVVLTGSATVVEAIPVPHVLLDALSPGSPL
jgi:hypothetical protein